MTTIALISDQHISRSSRWEEGLRILDWIASELDERRPDVICLGGDMFDARPTAEEWMAAARWLMRLADVAPVFGVYGNHDVPMSMSVFPHLNTRYPIVIADAPRVEVFGGVAIACLPWPRKANLLAALGGKANHENTAHAATEALRAVLTGLGAELGGHAGHRVFLGHCMVSGSRVSTGQPVAPGSDFEIGLADLSLAKADVYLFGHVHMPQRFSVMGAPGVMPGSPRRTSFGEVENKTFAWVTLDGRDVRVEDVTTPATRMLLLEAEWDAASGTLVGTHRLTDIDGAEVRLRYSVTPDQRDAARARAEEYRTTALARGAIVVKLEEVIATSARARAPEVAQAKTLTDKLRAYWAAKGEDLAEREGKLLDKAGELEKEAAA